MLLNYYVEKFSFDSLPLNLKTIYDQLQALNNKEATPKKSVAEDDETSKSLIKSPIMSPTISSDYDSRNNSPALSPRYLSPKNNTLQSIPEITTEEEMNFVLVGSDEAKYFFPQDINDSADQIAQLKQELASALKQVDEFRVRSDKYQSKLIEVQMNYDLLKSKYDSADLIGRKSVAEIMRRISRDTSNSVASPTNESQFNELRKNLKESTIDETKEFEEVISSQGSNNQRKDTILNLMNSNSNNSKLYQSLLVVNSRSRSNTDAPFTTVKCLIEERNKLRETVF